MDAKTLLHWLWVDLRTAAWDAAVNRLAGSSCVPRVGRYLIYRAVGLEVGSPALAPGIYIQSRRLRVGPRSFVNRGVRVYCGWATVTIGSRVQVAMGVTFVTDGHPVGGPEQRAGDAVSARPIVVGDGCWIGANATLLPGVTVGPGCVVAAGAVVTRDCQPNGLYAGVPARRVRDLGGTTT